LAPAKAATLAQNVLPQSDGPKLLEKLQLRGGSGISSHSCLRLCSRVRCRDQRFLGTRFAADSAQEGQGFEPSVPRRGQHFSGLSRSSVQSRPSVREEGSSARVQGLESRFPPPSEVSRAIAQRSRTPCQEPLARRRSCRRASRRCRAQFFACPVRCRGRRMGLSRFRVLWCGCGGRVLRLYGLRRDFYPAFKLSDALACVGIISSRLCSAPM
jgi:hypothetical protein